MELVSVEHDFEYKAKDGRLVSIKPNESYILVSKTNDHWWHVRKDLHSRPFYVPAQYVKELSAPTKDCPGPSKLNIDGCLNNSKHVNVTKKTPHDTTVVLRESAVDYSRETCRFSTFGFCDNAPDVKLCEPLKEIPRTSSFAHTLNDTKTHNSMQSFSFTSIPLHTEGLQLYAEPHAKPKIREKQQEAKSSLQDGETEKPLTVEDDTDVGFPSPPPLLYCMIPEINITEFDTSAEKSDPVASSLRLSLNQPAAPASPMDEQASRPSIAQLLQSLD